MTDTAEAAHRETYVGVAPDNAPTAEHAAEGVTRPDRVEGVRQAIGRLLKGRSWDDWCEIGRYVVELRTEAMRRTKTNNPEGQAYRDEFTALLRQHGIKDFLKLDKTQRSRLFTCMDHIVEIEELRAALPVSKRQKLNHPKSMLAAWKKAKLAAEKSDDAEAAEGGEVPPKPRTRAQLEAQLAERNALYDALAAKFHGVCELNGRLLAENQKLRTGGAFWDKGMPKEAIAKAIRIDLAQKLAPEEVEAVIEVLAACRATEEAAPAEQPPSTEEAAPAEQPPPSLASETTPAAGKPKRGRPKTGARKVLGAYRDLKKGSIHCDPNDARAESWAVLEYGRPEEDAKLQWMLIESCSSREKAEEVLATVASSAVAAPSPSSPEELSA
jgi:hypothetical protein